MLKYVFTLQSSDTNLDLCEYLYLLVFHPLLNCSTNGLQRLLLLLLLQTGVKQVRVPQRAAAIVEPPWRRRALTRDRSVLDLIVGTADRGDSDSTCFKCFQTENSKQNEHDFKFMRP